MRTRVTGWSGNEADVVAETNGDSVGVGPSDGEDDARIIDWILYVVPSFEFETPESYGGDWFGFQTRKAEVRDGVVVGGGT